MKHLSTLFATSLLVVLVTGCSSVPTQISSAPANDIQLGEVKGKTDEYPEQEVRWGGEIVKVENNNEASIIQIVQYPLNHYGKPITNQSSEGRFLAITNDFIDPVVYKEGTLLTFTGQIQGESTRKVDKRDLTMPLLTVSSMYKWQPYRSVQRDPFYDPFYYNGFYPYHGYYNRSWYRPRFGSRYYY